MEPSVPWAAALGLLEGRSVRGNSTRLVTTHPRLGRFPVQQHNRAERYKGHSNSLAHADAHHALTYMLALQG